MADETYAFRLTACRELMDSHPESLVLRQQVEALEEAMPDRPGIAVSFCRTLIETTCKTILIDRGQTPDDAWEAPKLISETTKFLHLGVHDNGHTDAKLKSGSEKLVRGVNSIIDGIVEIRNAHGTAAHGSDAYAPMLDARYAEILARATDAVVGLLFKSHLNSSRGKQLSRLRYSDYLDLNTWIDENLEAWVDIGRNTIAIIDTPMLLSKALFEQDPTGYQTAFNAFIEEQKILEAETADTETREADA